MRFPDWKERLRLRIVADQDRTFAWGEHDCILFACSCIEAMTGIDPAAEYRGQYHTEREARRLMKKLGFASPADAIKSKLPELPFLASMGEGDCVACGDRRWNALGVVFNGFIIAPDEKSLAAAPLKSAFRAFKVN